MRRTVLVALLASFAPGLAWAADPPPCHDYKEIARVLAKTYEEDPVSLGVQTNGNMLQVFASAKSGTFTVLSVAPTGFACILAAGRNWEASKAKAGDPEA
ncbi:MAG: hypothetical protein KDG89_03490 [Geminicoccaceae bacterium]|nr:hypothetical protein [Geminicoccaceae bacterium]